MVELYGWLPVAGDRAAQGRGDLKLIVSRRFWIRLYEVQSVAFKPIGFLDGELLKKTSRQLQSL